MSSGVNPLNGGDSTMPGNYESWPGVASRTAQFGAPSTPFPQLHTAPSTPFPQPHTAPSTPFPRLPMVPPMTGPSMRRPPIGPPLRPRRHRRRPLTPEIEIARRPRHHSSWGRNRVITVPLDHRPTLGLRGPPRRVVEIERVRCHRRQRPRSSYYEDDYYDPTPPPRLPQSIAMVANPIANPCLPPAQSSLFAASELLSNLTPEMINTLPKRIVHLQPIHLPGSQADANTELQTIVFPAEVINPVDGTLSVIQFNSGMNGGGAMNIQSTATGHFQPQLINIPNTIGTSIMPRGLQVSPGMAADPLMQRFRDLFQRLNIPQGNSISPAPNPSTNRPTIPNISQFDPTDIGPYPPANIQPTNPSNIPSYRPAGVAPTSTANITPYRSSSFAPSALASNPTYSPASNTLNTPAGISSYQPANITPYRSSSFTPSALASNPTYSPVSTGTSIPSDIGPYRPANITPYTNIANRPSGNPLLGSSFSSGPTAYTSSLPSASSGFSTAFPSLSSAPTAYTSSLPPASSGFSTAFPSLSSAPTAYTSSLPPASSGFSTAFPSLSSAPTSYQPNNTMPRSILRNTPSADMGNNNSIRLNAPNVSSLNDTARKTTTFA
jgi:hypothetical protein